MPEMETAYPLGYSRHEEERLVNQAEQLEGITREILLRAGLQPGMHVLDLGSGVGDVAITAARIVGESGTVVGVERAAASVLTAIRRSREARLDNVSFEQTELRDFRPTRTFDAIIGRFVLAYVAERVPVLHRLRKSVAPGGLLCFLELDMSEIAQRPPSDLFTHIRAAVLEGFAAGGAELDMGSKLYATIVEAGWPSPEMLSLQPVVGGPECRGYDDLAQAARSLALTGDGDMQIDTLAERLRVDAANNRRVLFMSRIVAAWSRAEQAKPA